MQHSENARYEMSISLSVLDHLGLNLYSNTPAVISEVIANAWDADATRVDVTIDTAAKAITVTDNGHGMDLRDINNRYLLVGYRRRDPSSQGPLTKLGRKPMGRKGIGKLSLFSIADRIAVHTQKTNSEPEAFQMDAEEIRQNVKAQEQSNENEQNPKVPRYSPLPIEFDGSGLSGGTGTTIKITDFKRVRLTGSSISGLRKRIARRFELLSDDFEIVLNGNTVRFEDRDYFHKARFIFQYGDHDYSVHSRNLDIDEETGERLAFTRPHRFDEDGNADQAGAYETRGWIAIARRSNDLDDSAGGLDDNLNRITVLMRGRVAQEDILQEYRLGGMITKYIFGEIHADFLDEDEEDIATTSRQQLAEDHPKYKALKNFLDTELRHIWTETNTLKMRRALETALESNPHVKQWYDNLRPTSLKKRAKNVFRGIDLANMDDEHKHDFYATAVLAFERLKLEHALDQIDEIDDSNMETFLKWLADMDAVEATQYLEIVRYRLSVINELQDKVLRDDYERELRDYIFEHLWLLDPAWERATEYENMEERLQNAVERVNIRGRETVQPDVRYRRISSAHVIIELKRASVRLRKTAIEDQLNDYIAAVREEIQKDEDERRYPIEAICLLGKLPIGWDNPDVRTRDERSLREYGIRVLTFDEMVNRAHSAYSKFAQARAPVNELRQTIEAIRSYRPPSDD